MNLFNTQFQRFSLGLDIEGVASRDNPDGAIMWVWGDTPVFSGSGVDDYRVISEPLNEQTIPTNISGSADFWTGQLGLNAPGFSISAEAESLRALCSTASRPAGSLVRDFGYGVRLKLSTPPSVGDVFWIGDESLRISSFGPGAGDEYSRPADRGFAGSTEQEHLDGADVYASPPYYLNRRMRLRLFDNQRETVETIWQGLLHTIRLDAEQATIALGGADTLALLFDAKGGTNTAWQVEGDYKPGNEISVVMQPDGVPQSKRMFQIGDCLVRMTSYVESIDNLNDPTPFDLTSHDEKELTPIPPDATVRELVCFLREQQNGVGTDNVVFSSFSQSATRPDHAAVIALQLMCSTGTGTNGTHDTLRRDWGLGIPVAQIDMAGWFEVIMNHPAPIDRLILNWDDNFSFEDVIINRLLTPFGMRPVPNSEGLLTLKLIESWNYDTVGELAHPGGDAFVFITPESIAIDYHVDTVVPRVSANIGVTPYGGDPDTITASQLAGNRTDYLGSSSPHTYNQGVLFKSRRESVELWLSEQAAKRRTRPPTLTCVVPLLSRADTWRGLNGPGRVPGLLDWVVIGTDEDNLPAPGLVGPDGERVHPNDTSITFAGVIVSKTVNFSDLSVQIDVVLSSWDRGDRPAMLIGPGCQILDAGASSPIDLDVAKYATSGGESGFLAGDDVAIVDAYGMPAPEVRAGMVLAALGVDLEIGGLVDLIQSSDDRQLRHVDYPEYDNPALAIGFYQNATKNRKTAFLADGNGELSGDPGDEYV